MKKTRRLISAAALLLAALMLFTACGASIKYSEVDPAKYVTIADKDYKELVLSVDRMLVKEKDVTEYINKLLYTDYKEKYPDTTGTNQPGTLSKHDVITYRTYVYDKKGNLVQHDFAVTKATDTTKVTVDESLSLPLGYGINKDLPAEIENAILESGVLFQSVQVVYNNIADEDAVGLKTIPAIGYLKYNSTVVGDNSSSSTPGKGDTTVKPVHFVPYMNKAEQGEHDFMEAIYLGLKTLIEAQYAADSNNPVKPSGETSKVLNINVYPVGTEIPANVKEPTATSVAINYNLDFSGATTSATAQSGTIKVTLLGAVTLLAEDGAAFKTTYSFPDDATGEYKNAAGETLKIKDAKDCEVYVYVDSRQQYTCPEYDSKFVLETLKFETDLTEADAVIAAHRESIRKQLQDESDELARKDAIKKVWAAVCDKATFVKVPERNIKNYVKQNMAWYIYLYYDPNQYFPNGAKNYETSTGVLVYDDFDEFLASYYVVSNDDGSTTTFKSEKEVRAHLYAEGKEIAKNNLLAYLLADLLDLRYTAEELEALKNEKGAAWIKERVDELRAELTVTVETPSAEKEKIEKTLAQLGFKNAAEIPDDYLTMEDYVTTYGDVDTLYGLYHVEAIAEKLYELNYKNGGEDATLTYKDVDYVAPEK